MKIGDIKKDKILMDILKEVRTQVYNKIDYETRRKIREEAEQKLGTEEMYVVNYFLETAQALDFNLELDK